MVDRVSSISCWACLLSLSLAVTAHAHAVTVNAVETAIDTSGADQFDASISGTNIVYTSNSSGSSDIALSTTPGFVFGLATGTSEQSTADIDGNTVVYVDNELGNNNIYTVDTSTGVATLLDGSTSSEFTPAISGTDVLYVTTVLGGFDVVYYDLTNGLAFALTNSNAAFAPAIGSTYWAWEDAPGATFDIDGGEIGVSVGPLVQSLDDEKKPSISGDFMAYLSAGDVFLYDFTTGSSTNLTNDAAIQTAVALSGDSVFFTDASSGNEDIYVYVRSLGQRFQLTTDPSDQVLTDADGTTAVFHDDRFGTLDVFQVSYSIEPVPVPVGGAAGLLVLVCSMLRFAAWRVQEDSRMRAPAAGERSA